jgi:hypothetical protein
MGLLIAALLATSPARADIYRWKDADGVQHYADELERVPAQYRGAAELVTPRRAKSQGPLPVFGGERPPDPEEAGFAEPGLGERAPAESPRSVPEPQPAAELAPVAKPLAPLEQPPARPAAPPAQPEAAAEPIAVPPADADPRELEIAELERELAARREELKALISQTSFDSSQISADPRLRELAEIVPRLQAELDALRGELGHP